MSTKFPSGNAYLDMNDISGEVTLAGTVNNQWEYLETTWNSGSNTSVQLRLVTDGNPSRDFWFDDVSLIAQNETTHRTYYPGGGLRVLTSGSNQVVYTLGDHLGSTSVTANSDGTLAARMLYSPWGETRYFTGTTPTDNRYTGQKQTLGAGLEWLYFYNARWLDVQVGRFLQADTVIPDPVSGQGFNRYSYTNNNPIKYTDSSGHCWDLENTGSEEEIFDECYSRITEEMGIKLSSESRWNFRLLAAIYTGLSALRNAIGQDAYDLYLRGITVTTCEPAAGCSSHSWDEAANTVQMIVYGNESRTEYTRSVVHEFGHALVDKTNTDSSIYDEDNPYSFINLTGWQQQMEPCLFGIWRCSKWQNPETGPTQYSRGHNSQGGPLLTGGVPPEEDAMEALAVALVPGPSDFPITSERNQWVRNWLFEIQKQAKNYTKR